jgi:lipopolysaccharide/colanic/teichoic acid biosynthesis glycosyltransferase
MIEQKKILIKMNENWYKKYSIYTPLIPYNIYLKLKRGLDILLSVLALIVLSPIFIAVIFIQKTISPKSPVFYLQRRTGSNGKRFKMFKFRSMVPDADLRKEELLHLNHLSYPDFKIVNDPRVTKFGKFLRKTSLDELPQILNIIKGDMSIVGPRPTSFDVDSYALWHTERLTILPGLTGLWQITHRGDSEFNQRVALDIFYINHCSFLFDFEIVFRTALSIFISNGVT